MSRRADNPVEIDKKIGRDLNVTSLPPPGERRWITIRDSRHAGRIQKKNYISSLPSSSSVISVPSSAIAVRVGL